MRAAREGAAAGELPGLTLRPGLPDDPSALRPVPPALGGGPGQYASTMPHALAAGAQGEPSLMAAALAWRLAAVPWIATARAAGGYLAVTVTAEALAGLAAGIPQAGDCAASDILAGLAVPGPPAADLAAAQCWPQARALVAAQVTAALAAKAGAQVSEDIAAERLAPDSPRAARPDTPVQAALGYAGRGAVRYALLSRVGGRARSATVHVPVRYHLDNPVYAIRYAHAHAASTLRQAADLGLRAGEAAEFAPRQLSHPVELALLDAMSWLPERVAWAARARRPGEFARYLAELAGAYHDCREICPAVPFGGPGAPRSPDGCRARLWLVTAARTAIAAGLELIGISAPDRL